MSESILVTGSTDGIGLETAKMLCSKGHHVLLHGRNPSKLEIAGKDLAGLPGAGPVETYLADMSRMDDVEALAKAVTERHARLGVLINNAGIYVPGGTSHDGFDVRFAVNTIAPYLLTKRLQPLLGITGRVVNLSSAAQAPVDPVALAGQRKLSDGEAYAQSKLALTMWSRAMALSLNKGGPVIVSVNPGSMLGSKMVKEAYGVAGGDIGIGADILTRAALGAEFADASGQYFDNDVGRFASPHQDVNDLRKCEDLVRAIEALLGNTN